MLVFGISASHPSPLTTSAWCLQRHHSLSWLSALCPGLPRLYFKRGGKKRRKAPRRDCSLWRCSFLSPHPTDLRPSRPLPTQQSMASWPLREHTEEDIAHTKPFTSAPPPLSSSAPSRVRASYDCLVVAAFGFVGGGGRAETRKPASCLHLSLQGSAHSANGESDVQEWMVSGREGQEPGRNE